MPSGKNTAIDIQEALVKAANGYGAPVELSRVLRDAEAETGVQVNSQWAAEALESRGFFVDDQPDRMVKRLLGTPIDPPA